MATYKNWDDLVKGLQGKVNNALENEVSKEIKTKLKKRYDEDVYSYDYNDSFRTRRHSLTDDNNLVSSVEEDGTLLVENIAQPDKSVWGTPITNDDPNLLSRWIEDGSITNIFNDRTDYPWTKPRPVIETVQEDIEKSGSAINALKKGLKRQKIDLV